MIKRLLDVVSSLLILLVAAPILLLVAVFIRATMGSPVFFRQWRAGRHGKPFVIYKFRSMRDLRDANGRLLPDELRLTRLGKFLRSTSLDALPEFLNVLKGEESLVGPRPLLVEYLDRYTPEQARRHDVRPGITGWAQINGRNSISWDMRFKLDVWYVEHHTLWLDFKILFLTVYKTLTREGINAEGHATMPEFLGQGDPPRVRPHSISES